MSQDRIKAALGDTWKLPDTIQAETGLSAPEVLAGLSMLEVSGEAEAFGGRYRLKAKSPGTLPKAHARPARRGTGRRVTARKGSAPGQAPQASSPGSVPRKAGEVVRKGKGFTARRGPARGAGAYPVQVCSVRYKDPETGQWARKPKDAPAPGRVRKGRSVDAAPIVMRSITEHGDGQREVTGARVVMGNMRAGQRRGKVKKGEVREVERELGRDALRSFNPRLVDEVDRERMHEAHRSDKSKRGAATRKKNRAAGIGPKKRPADVVRTELLRTEELVRDARRRHERAVTAAAKTRHADALKKRQARLSKLRAELKRVEG